MYSEEVIEFHGDLWTRKYVEMYMSNHIWAHSACETANSCGNCDGGNCHGCHPIWQVTIMSLPETEEHKKLCEIIGRPLSSYKRFNDELSAMEYFESA